MSTNRSKVSRTKRPKSGTDLNSDTDSDDYSDSDDNKPQLEMKLGDERRKSRHSEESLSSPSTSLSPNMFPMNMSPGVIPILKQNKSRGERPRDEINEAYNYSLPALDLAYSNYIYNNNNTKPMNNTLNLSNEIIDDVYDSLCSWNETEIDSNDKQTMNINQFIQFCNKYIYSTLCIDDKNDLITLENHKDIITRAIFENICFHNSDEIQFEQLLNAINKLKKKQFINALNIYHSIFFEHDENENNNDNDNDKKQLDYSNIIIEPRDNDEKIMLFGDNNLQNLLMKDVKKLFEKYDLMKCGQLNISQFKCLLNELYPTFNDDDFRHICSEIINNTNNNNNNFQYKQNINLLKSKIEKFNKFPDKNEFLQLLIEIYNDNNNSSSDNQSYAFILTECKSYDDLNRIFENSIDLVINIRKQFIKNIKNKNAKGHEIEITKTCVEDLWRWIDEYGIPSIRQNETVQNEHINNDIIEKYNNLCDEYNIIKNKIKLYEETKNNNHLVKQINILKNIFDTFNIDNKNQNNKQIKQIELLNENIIQIKNIIPTIGNDFSIEKMKSKLLEKDIMINKLENKIKIYDENNNIIEYIKNNMITKNNLKTIRDRNKMYAMLMFLNGIAFGYIVGIKLRKNRKLLFHSTAGLSGISFLGFNQWDHKYWGKLLSVSTGFLIGFSVASKM